MDGGVEHARVADRLVEAAASALVGRARERQRLAQLVAGPERGVVVFVHGPGGIGKSALVAGTVAELERPSVAIDGRAVEPTASGLLGALAAAVGASAADLEAVTTALADAGVSTVVLDSYERLGIVDGWLRNVLIPALPAAVTTVLVGRYPPNLAWRTAPGWRALVGELVVGPLTDADAAALLERRALPAPVRETALRFARGHPLALELAAEALGRHPDLVLHAGPPPEVIEELVEVLFDDLTADQRRIVEAASVLRRITEPLLAAVLDAAGLAPAVTVASAWRTIRDLPVTVVSPGGLELSPVVHDVAATGLELRDPGLARALRRGAARAALAEVERNPGWAATADLLHLVQNPVIRDAFVPPPGLQHPVEAAREDDRAPVLAITERHRGADEAAAIARWWDAHQSGVVVARGEGNEITAFSVVVEAAAVAPTLADDPVMATVAADLQARPLAPGQRALVNRISLSAERGGSPSPHLALMLVDIKRTYLEMRPDLARVYVARHPTSSSGPMMTAMGFGPPLPNVGASDLETCALDFGPGSVDAWLARHVEVESSAQPAPAPATEEPAALATLSPREREVLAALADGLSNNELAERLFISERTANRHLSNIFTKLGVRNRTAAARVAIEAGLAG